MAQVEKASFNPADFTELVDRGLPKSWKCPHCGSRNSFDEYAEEILMTYSKVLRHCERCGYVHMWQLRLTDGFKKKVVETLLGGIENE